MFYYQVIARNIASIFSFDYKNYFYGSNRLFILYLLLSIDLLALATDITVTLLKEYNPDLPSWILWDLRIDTEYSIWAFYGYAKLAVIALLMSALYMNTRLKSYLYLAIVFAYTTMDDALLFHERAGRAIVSSGILPQSGWSIDMAFSEAAYFLPVGVIILLCLFFAIRSAEDSQRPQVIVMALFMLMIGFFAVFIDFIDGAMNDTSRYVAKFLSLMDDGGELVVSSFAVVFALSIWQQRPRRSSGAGNMRSDLAN